MTITANDIIASLWNLACTLPAKTGGRTRSQKSALKQLVTVPGGLVFIVTRSRKEIEELQRRGIWPTNLDSIARAVAGLELQGRRLMRVWRVSNYRGGRCCGNSLPSNRRSRITWRR